MEPPLTSTSIMGKDSMGVFAKEKVWADADNNLVPDGDEKADRLIAVPGRRTTLNFIRKHPNFREFFEPANAGEKFPEPDAEEEAEQELAKPKRGPGRPPKVQNAPAGVIPPVNAIEAENDAALAEVYGNDLADGGEQAESVEIDGQPVLGNLDFDASSIEVIFGGTNENVTAAFHTLKRYFPAGKFPTPLKSRAEVTVNGKITAYQVRQLNGDKDNRATLTIGLGAFTNRK